MQKLTVTLIALLIVVISARAEVKDVDADSSTVTWTAYHIAKSYQHQGTVSIKSGSIEFIDDEMIGGEITMDMSTIAITDDMADDKKGKLAGHLKSNDFFNAEEHPYAKLQIKSAKNTGNDYTVYANITIRGITEEISFQAKRNGDIFTASFEIDRTAHQVLYGWSIENVVISNKFKLDVNLVLN